LVTVFPFIAEANAHTDALLQALRRLDVALAQAVACFDALAPGDEAEASGLYITPQEIARLLADEPDLGYGDGAAGGLALHEPGSRLADLAARFGLTPLDADLLLIAVAPEIDRRYERIYGYLQDDMTRRRPTVDLALRLLLPDAPARLAARGRLAPSAPLLRHGLLRLLDDPQDYQPPLLLRSLAPEARVVDFLLDIDEIDGRLAPLARLAQPGRDLAELALSAGLARGLAGLAGAAEPGMVIQLQGPYGAGKATIAAALCRAWGLGPLLVVDGERAVASEPELSATLRALGREALLRGTPVLWEGADSLLADERRAQRAALLALLADLPTPSFLAGTDPWPLADPPSGLVFLGVEIPPPDAAARERLWRGALGQAAPDALQEIAGAFRLSAGQIRDAAVRARGLARWRDPVDGALTPVDLYAASRMQASPRLAGLARKIRPHFSWDDLVLPADRKRQLRELCDQVRHRPVVHEQWGFERRLALGKGLTALFAGQSGTGKTMAAEVIAAELGLDLYKIDLATVVSKYIGETEKNLARVFAEAESSGTVLFFDEADALFGKRSEVKDAHDRYANLEVAYLLQRMEEYEGISILATNLRQSIDDAFVRRLQFIVEFPLPGAAERRQIWEQCWPADTPRDESLDLGLLAERCEVAGGHIRNVALAAAFLAAANGGAVTMGHIAHALRREYQKLGRVIGRGEFDL
jgi:hypothetical protein